MASSFEELRVEYRTAPLEQTDLDPDPFVQLSRWLDAAVAAEVEEPNAFILATSADDGRPAARAVLLKGLSPEGLVFFTNYRSRKAAELAANPQASAVFLWVPIRRQVRVEGLVEKVASEVSDEYFASRPVEARLASAASPQSEVVESRQHLEELLEDLHRAYPEGDVPRPAHWGGYRLIPDYFEFWQGREARFHDRFRYVQSKAVWRIDRLAP
jgi:pyridoxamine 5'-phosphate oxidase